MKSGPLPRRLQMFSAQLRRESPWVFSPDSQKPHSSHLLCVSVSQLLLLWPWRWWPTMTGARPCFLFKVGAGGVWVRVQSGDCGFRAPSRPKSGRAQPTRQGTSPEPSGPARTEKSPSSRSELQAPSPVPRLPPGSASGPSGVGVRGLQGPCWNLPVDRSQ